MSVCVTGFGIVDALGSSGDECYSNYMTPHDSTSPLDTGTSIHRSFKVRTALQMPAGADPAHLSKTSQMALHVVHQACEMAGVPRNSNVAVIFSSSVPVDLQDQFYAHKHGATTKRLGPRKLLDSLPGAAPALISSFFGFDGLSIGINAACATGLTSLDYAMHCVDDYDYVIVGAGESPSLTTAAVFNTLGALSNHSRPFDTTRSGFVLGEGAGCLVLESEEKARARNAVIFAQLHKPGISTDRGTDVAPDPMGIGAKTSMQKAIDNAGIGASDIDFVNAHATSTVLGDAAEYSAVRSLTSAPMYSCKGMIGHLLTAAGVNELIYSILFARRGHSGFNVNLNNPPADSEFLPTSPIYTNKLKTITLKNSFGFGKRCTSIILEVNHAQ